MKRFLTFRLVFSVIGVSCVLMMATYLRNKYLYWTQAGLQIPLSVLDLIQIPAFVIASIMGALMNKNPHNPIVSAYYISLFITYVVIFGGLITLFRFARKHVHKIRVRRRDI